VAGLPVSLPGLCRTAESVWSTRLQTFLTVLSFHPLSGYNWKWWLSHQVLAHEASAFNTQNLTLWKRWVYTCGKINAIWCFKINIQKLADICGYELPTNLQTFHAERLNRSENIPKIFFGGRATFFETPGLMYSYNLLLQAFYVYDIWLKFIFLQFICVLLSRCSRQRERLSASVLPICSSVCLSVTKIQKHDFVKN